MAQCSNVFTYVYELELDDKEGKAKIVKKISHVYQYFKRLKTYEHIIFERFFEGQQLIVFFQTSMGVYVSSENTLPLSDMFYIKDFYCRCCSSSYLFNFCKIAGIEWFQCF